MFLVKSSPFHAESGVVESLQKECDKARTSQEIRQLIRHTITSLDRRFFVQCSICDISISLGMSSQRLANFKIHCQSHAHQAKLSDKCGGESSVSELTAKGVLHDIKDNSFKVKNGAVYCVPCGKSFDKNSSKETLAHNVATHQSTQAHKKQSDSIKSIPTIDTFFKKKAKTKSL